MSLKYSHNQKEYQEDPYDKDCSDPMENCYEHTGPWDYMELRPQVNSLRTMASWLLITIKAQLCIFRIKLAFWIIPKK